MDDADVSLLCLNNSYHFVVPLPWGFYWLSHDRCLLARLVELRERGEAVLNALEPRVPLLEALHREDFRPPQVDCSGGKGHIIWHRPFGANWRAPSVGLDRDLCYSLVHCGHVEWIEFVVYSSGYREVEYLPRKDDDEGLIHAPKERLLFVKFPPETSVMADQLLS